MLPQLGQAWQVPARCMMSPQTWQSTISRSRPRARSACRRSRRRRGGLAARRTARGLRAGGRIDVRARRRRFLDTRAASAAAARPTVMMPIASTLVVCRGTRPRAGGRCSRRGCVANRMSGSSVMPAGSKRMLREHLDERLERHAVLQAVAHRDRERVHDAGERRALLGDLEEQLTRATVLVLADGHVAVAVGDPERERLRSCACVGSFWRTGSCTMTVSTIRSTIAGVDASLGDRPSSASRAAGRPCSCRGRARRPSARAATTRCAAPRRLRPSPPRAC